MSDTLGQMLASKLNEMSLRAEVCVDERSITFRAAHPTVGDLKIYDEGDELTVIVGNVAHRHFAEADEAAQFVKELLSDVWGFSRSGFMIGASERRGLFKRLLGGRRYVWSGPL